MKKSLLIPILLLVCPAAALGQTKIAWRLNAGDSFLVEETIDTQQRLTLMQSETQQDVSETRVLHFRVIKKNKDESIVLEQKILDIKLKYAGDGPDVDSKVLKQLEGAAFVVTLDSRGTVLSFTGYEKLVKKITKEDSISAKLVRALITKQTFVSGIESLFGFTPEKTVAAGQSWSRKLNLPLGPLGNLILENQYQLDSPPAANKNAKVSFGGKAQYAPPAKTADNVFTVKGGDLRLLKAEGIIHFDTARGRLVNSHAKYSLQGKLQVSVRGSDLEMQLHQDQTRRLQVLDKNPLKK